MSQEEDEDVLVQLQQALDSDPESPTNHFNLAVYLWKKEDVGEDSKSFKARAAEHFVASAKLNPGNAAAFRFLGHYYSKVVEDSNRAAKCYQRTLSLDPDDFEAGESFCDLLAISGKESLEVAVCKESSVKSPRAFWAFRRLGYLQVHHKKWEESVQNLQHAIRGYPSCADLWEALGLAYHRLGRFTAAIKSYGRAVELENYRIFSLIESGNILLMLKSFRKGIEHFRHALEISPLNISAKFGLASGLLGQSKECASMGAYNWAATLLEEASQVAGTCTRLSNNFSSVWKLYGDIQLAYAKCIPWEGTKVDLQINELVLKTSIDDWKMRCLSAAKKANILYQRALHLAPWECNIYADIAITLDLIYSLEGTCTDCDARPLPEWISLGSLICEGSNAEFWVVLACMTNNYSLKQHALIRGLQLDLSFAVAWAYLGKLYRDLGENQLACQAYDRARSLDPSLALSWAGMSVAFDDRNYSQNEAYESCLRAVQLMPLAEFQIGLGMLAVLTGHLSSPQVFAAIRHSIQRAPYYPESHNIHGLICESLSDYQCAISAYQLARSALKVASMSEDTVKSCFVDVSVNLARALYQAGLVDEAKQECEALDKVGMLDCKGLQIYALSLWKLGKNEESLFVARTLAKNISKVEKSSAAVAAITMICQLIYRISGLDVAKPFIFKLPREYLHDSKMGLIISALHALDSSNQLQSLLPSNHNSSEAYGLVTEIHNMTAISKMINNGSEKTLDIHSGTKHLRRAIHLYPDNNLIRNQLGMLLLCSGDWLASSVATRCAIIPTRLPVFARFISPFKVHGGSGATCYASCVTSSKFSFPTCKCQPANSLPVSDHIQKWLHQEPWNNEAHYLLILDILQRTSEEKFPPHLSLALKRLIAASLFRQKLSVEQSRSYQRFILLLCASEICLQCFDYADSLTYATTALGVLPFSSDAFFAHLQLCRIHAAREDLTNLSNEYMNCLNVKTVHPIGWISLKFIESRYKLQTGYGTVDLNFQLCCKELVSSHMWEAIFGLVRALCYISDEDFINAEHALVQVNIPDRAEGCLLLVHGAVCMELARQQMGSHFLSRAVQCLVKAQRTLPSPMPIVSTLLAQAEGSLGAKAKWERNLRLEWFSWPAEIKPAEVYFQMHILARQTSGASNKQMHIESQQSPEKWVLRAIHLNPSCLRYWKVLLKLTSGS